MRIRVAGLALGWAFCTQFPAGARVKYFIFTRGYTGSFTVVLVWFLHYSALVSMGIFSRTSLVGRCSRGRVRRGVLCLRTLSRRCPGVRSTTTRVVGLRTVLSLPGNARRFLSSVRNRRRTFERVLGGTSNSVERGVSSLFSGALASRRHTRLTALVCCPGRGLDICGDRVASVRR